MHENDFRNQFAAVMEILVKDAVRETTKLYETGVRELRIEMAQVKEENVSLKERLMYSEIRLKYMMSSIEKIKPNERCQQTEERGGDPPRFPDPPGQADGDEEEEEEEINPAAALKEESPEVQFVLIKQEDSDIEECSPGTPPIQRRGGAVLSASLAAVATAPAAVQDPLPIKGRARGATGRGHAPLPPLPTSRSCPRDHQEARLRGRASEDQQGTGALSGGGAERGGAEHGQEWAWHVQEGAGHEQEGAGLAFSHHFLDGWGCGPGLPLQPLPGNSRQGQPDAAAFQCGECGRVLSSAAALDSHRSVHTGERPHRCTQCGKTFPSLRGLTRHSQVHAAERPHRCTQCGKTFVYQFSLTKHQLVHSGERPHACKLCGKSFVFKSDLTIHTRMHTGEKPYGCSVCGKEFKHRRALTLHQQGHSGERRHHCPYCAKSFLDLGNFKRHKRIHTGEKPYGCPVCGKTFTQSAHLKKHVLTHK
ncbi:zinc finger protein 696-like isoform X2 [Conger conger]|uniref:zinc finger protein 696-like isoform X2 n=1 Tax=Conger conger TaxID=82655 RepID=UPI002A5A2DC2|nr:zinc finger protein 696-like isoform X2 [Conger conger]